MRFQLETTRLILRPVEAAQARAFAALCNEPGVRRYLFDDERVSDAFVREILARSDMDFEAGGFGIWLLHQKGVDGAIGFCGLREFRDLNDVEILYALSESMWHRGFAVEAAQAVLAYALDTLGLPRVIGVIEAPNHASWRVLEKLGMVEFQPIQARAHLRYAKIETPSE